MLLRSPPAPQPSATGWWRRLAFSSQSGLRPVVTGVEVAEAQPAFTYYQVGARLGYRLNRNTTTDVFLDGILAPRATGSSAHFGFGARWNF